jgi:hypothetical protein
MKLTRKRIKLNRKLFLSLLLVCLGGLVACDDKNAAIQPPGATSPTTEKSAGAQVDAPSISMDKTRELFALATEKDIGDKNGLFEMRQNGILVHPGETKSTRISFKLSRAFQSMTVRPFIAALPPEAAVKEAGTVGVEFLLDGKSAGRASLDRDSKQIKTLNLTNLDTLTVVVDNGDGKPWFDWLMLGVVELK